MKILVTGSLGNLGSELVPALEQPGREVWGCDLRHSHHRNFVRADIAEHRQLAEVFARVEPDVVYNLAAEFGRHNGRDFPEQLWRTGQIGLRNVISLCDEYGAHLIHASSSEIYGELDLPDEHGLLAEGLSDARPMRPTNDYAVSKYAGELMCRNAMPDQRITVLRFFNAYGREYYHPYRSVVCLWVYRLLHGLPITVFRGYHRVFMWIDDFIPTLAQVCEQEATIGRAVNIGGSEYRSVEELAELCLEATGAPRHLVSYEDFEAHNVRNKRPDISLAEALLGHEPVTPLEVGVPETVRWMRGVYGL